MYKVIETLKSGKTNIYFFESRMQYQNHIALSKQYANYKDFEFLKNASYKVEYISDLER